MRPVREHAMGIVAAVPIWPAERKGQAMGAPDGFGSEHSLDIDSDSTRAVAITLWQSANSGPLLVFRTQ
jgi:hypothetical protein